MSVQRFWGSGVINIPQTLMKRQEIETCLQTVSQPTASIGFYLETDVRVINTRQQPPARHSRHWFCWDIFQSNQRAVKSLLCKSLELQGPLGGIAFSAQDEFRKAICLSCCKIHKLLLVWVERDGSLLLWYLMSQSGSVEQLNIFVLLWSGG